MIEQRDIERLYQIIHFPQRIPMLQYLREFIPSDLLDEEIRAQRKRAGVTVNDKTSPEDVINAVLGYFGVEYANIIKPDRRTEVKIPRMVAMIAVYAQCNCSLTTTGIIFNRDHATILHAHKAIGGLIEVDNAMRQRVYDCFKALHEQGITYPMSFFFKHLPEKFVELYPRP